MTRRRCSRLLMKNPGSILEEAIGYCSTSTVKYREVIARLILHSVYTKLQR